MDGINHPTPLITASSALRRIPPHVDPADKVVFDGIRFSLEILDRAHRGLRESLWALSQQERNDPVDVYVDVLANAWQMIDCLNRLASLFEGSSGYLDHDFCREYADLLAHVALPRNAIQHVKGRQEKIIADKEPVWGILGWASCVGSLPDLKAHIYCFAPGAIRTSELPVMELPERPFYPPIDGIVLRAAKTDVHLSELMLSTAGFAHLLDAELSKSFPEGVDHGRDAFMSIPLSFNDTGIRTPKLTVAFTVPHANRAARRTKGRKS